MRPLNANVEDVRRLFDDSLDLGAFDSIADDARAITDETDPDPGTLRHNVYHNNTAGDMELNGDRFTAPRCGSFPGFLVKYGHERL